MKEYLISKYPPVALSIATLEPDEEHLCSFHLTECQKNPPFGYGSYCTVNFNCHITDWRLIFEYEELPKWLIPTMKIGLSLVDAPVSATVGTRMQLWEANETNKKFSGKAFDILYGDIKRFETIKDLGSKLVKILLKEPPEELNDDGLVYIVHTINNQKGFKAVKDWFSNFRVNVAREAECPEDFAEIGNALLESFVKERKLTSIK